MPAAIGLEIRLAVLPTDDRRVVVTLDDTGETAEFDLDAIGAADADVDRLRRRHRLGAGGGRPTELRGFRGAPCEQPARGCRAVVVGGARDGGGTGAPGLRAPPGRREPRRPGRPAVAENGYVGVQSGVMDQFASAAGVADHAILLDCRSLEWRPVPLPLAECALVVCHSGSPHKLETSAYNQRLAECERAVAAIATLEPVGSVAAGRRLGDARGRARLGWTTVAARRATPRRRGERPGPRDRAGAGGRATWQRSGGCSLPATPRCATCSR